MDIFLNRRGGVSVRDQIVTQLELRILDGTLAPGSRLPSVRALARRLEVHANTVSAAYQDLQRSGTVTLRRGSGVFVRPGAPTGLPEARGLDEMIRLALHAAFRKGFSGSEIRAAVERWLAAAPPRRIVVVDPVPQMAQLVACEVKEALGLSVESCSLEDVAREPGRLSGVLALTLPYHLEALSRLAPGAAVEMLNVEMSPKDRDVVMGLPTGAVVLLVTYSPTVIPFATVLLRSLRGDEILAEARLLSAAREWRRLLPAADLVLADALSAPAVRRYRPKRLREVRVVTGLALSRLKDALAVVAPKIEAQSRA